MSSSSPENSSTLLALSNNLADAVEQAGSCVVAVKARTSYRGDTRSRLSSSGIHWRSGIIVTADETIKRSEDITVTLDDGRTVPATLAGRDSSTDIAVLKLPDVELPVAQVGAGQPNVSALSSNTVYITAMWLRRIANNLMLRADL